MDEQIDIYIIGLHQKGSSSLIKEIMPFIKY
jgi:hypothetical protein